MQPRTPHGRYSNSKCVGGKKYRPLQFETFKASGQTVAAESSLTSLLTDVDLGPVDRNWFDRKLETQKPGGCDDEHVTKQKRQVSTARSPLQQFRAHTTK